MSKLVSVQVSEERKERWEKAAKENPEVGSLSGFVRGAVEARIRGGDGGDGGGADSETLNEILEAVQETNSRVSDLEGRISAVEGLVRGDPEIEELSDRLFGVLPTKSELAPLQIEKRSGEGTVAVQPQIKDWGDGAGQEAVPIRDLPDRALTNSGHVLGLAEVLGESPYSVEKALEELMAETYTVKTTDHNGETLYYREE